MIKARQLSRLLGALVSPWSWAPVWAAVPATITSCVTTQVPEWAELIIGVPAVLAVYCWII